MEQKIGDVNPAFQPDVFSKKSSLLRLYCQDFTKFSTGSHWKHCGRGSVLDGDTKDGVLYGVGTESWSEKGMVLVMDGYGWY